VEVHARLLPVRTPARPDGIALVLHGGGSREQGVRVSPTQLSVLRMVPVARRVARAGRGRLAVWRLLNSTRGWDAGWTPVDDVGWALDELAQRYGADVPVSLVGHSLGGRAALLSADRAPVRSVVAMAPWVYVDDGVEAPGRRALFVHGDEDRVADLPRARAVAARMARTASVGFVTVTGGKHSMLRRGRVFDALAADFVAETLDVRRATGTLRPVLDGAETLVV